MRWCSIPMTPPGRSIPCPTPSPSPSLGSPHPAVDRKIAMSDRTRSDATFPRLPSARHSTLRLVGALALSAGAVLAGCHGRDEPEFDGDDGGVPVTINVTYHQGV